MSTLSPTRDPEQTRARILEAAEALFVEQGFSAVRLSELARSAGVTKSLIHHHFGSKEKLWEAVKDRAFERYFTAQMSMLEEAGEPDVALLRASVEAYFHFLRDNPGVVRLFAWAHLEGDDHYSELDAELVGAGAEWVRQAQRRGVLRADVNPTNVIAVFVMACTQWFETKSHCQQWPGMGSDAAFLEDFLTIFLEGVTPRG
ncbi:TetR/AcrR family transcriptional regulator [Billgrantia azerbaijanica]|nr:TetR/AcrR family transcriptional regulator [Halomonas azerbaijanica]